MHRRGLSDGVRLIQNQSSRLVIDPSQHVFARIQYPSLIDPGEVIHAEALVRIEEWSGSEVIIVHEGSLAGQGAGTPDSH